jgi:uncharacterized membrane protein YedE/YeeE
MKNIKYLFLGIVFGIILCKVEAVSWWRMQEMFCFDGWHLYGLFATAIPTGIISILLIKKLKIKTISGEPIVIATKKFDWGYVIGGVIFGIGWAFSGACPGPLLALIGMGKTVVIVVFLSALAGTWTYSYFKRKLPH